jgi:hypothetical protein
MLGKRKRETVVATREDRCSSTGTLSINRDEKDSQAIFRSYFEAQFEPLDKGAESLKTKAKVIEQVEELENSSDSEWSGFSPDEASEVEVVSHVNRYARERDELNKYELKSFMVCLDLRFSCMYNFLTSGLSPDLTPSPGIQLLNIGAKAKTVRGGWRRQNRSGQSCQRSRAPTSPS